MKTSLFRFQICLWAQFIFIYRTSDQAFKQKPLDQKIMIKKKKLAVHAKNTQYESDATFTSILIESVICVEISSDLVTASEPLLSEWNTVSEMTLCSVTAGVTPIRPCDDLSVERGGGRRGLGSCTVAPGYQQGPLFNGEEGVRKPCGRWPVIYTLILSYISLLLCSLVLVCCRWGPWNLGCVWSGHVTGDWFWKENSMQFVC